MKKFEFLEHTADVKFRVKGKNLNEVFENSVLAVSDFLARGRKIKPIKEKRVSLKGSDLEELFYNFLDELVYLLDAEEFVVAKAKLEAGERTKTLKGTLFGDDAKNCKDLDHFKAATYSEMYVKPVKGKNGKKLWEAQAVLDV